MIEVSAITHTIGKIIEEDHMSISTSLFPAAIGIRTILLPSISKVNVWLCRM